MGRPLVDADCKQGRHLARVQRVDARIAVAGEEHHRGIGCAGLHVLIGRVLQQVGELLFVLR